MDSLASIWMIDRAVGERDYTYLSKLIGEPNLPPVVREHLALTVLALLTKKIAFPAHRPEKMKTFTEKMAIGARVRELKNQRAKKPFETVSVEFNCCVRKVQSCWAVYRDLAEELSRAKHENDALREMAYEANRAAAVQSLKEEHGDRDFSEEEIEAAEHELNAINADNY